MKKLVIIGAGTFAKESIWIVQEINKFLSSFEIVGLVDEDMAKEGLNICGYPVFGELKNPSYWGKEPIYAVCSVGRPTLRKNLSKKGIMGGYQFVNIVHPGVIVSDYVSMGVGNVIMPGTVISVDVTLGSHLLINKLCSIGHDSTIQDYCTLAPGVKVGGNVLIEEGCDIGMNASILQSVKIGTGAVIGAGAVVINDLPAGCTAVGVPAKVIK